MTKNRTIFVLFIVVVIGTIATSWISLISRGLNATLTSILDLFVAIFYNPIFWVSVFGPFIQSFHFLWLRSKLGIGYKAKSVGELPNDLKPEEDELEELRKVLNENQWAYAFNDFSTQLFVTLIAFIFLCLNVAAVITKFYTSSCGDSVYKVLSSDTYSLVVLIGFVSFYIFGVYVLLSGRLISHKILRHYKPDGHITGETRMPPLASGLTLFRYAITIYSVVYAMWANNHVPMLLEMMKRT